VAAGITLVTEPHVAEVIQANVYLVSGGDADLVVDTGTGIASLWPALSERAAASRRVTAVATHAHFDHVGGMHEFAERLVHLQEAAALAGQAQFASLLGRDFPAAWRAQVSSYAATMRRLRSLPGVRLVCPGHGPCFDGARLTELCDAYLAGGRSASGVRAQGRNPGSSR
jgi:glyoxylase-like metal-dependent hydrolase (beta-lactamase superfamily II)